MATGDRVSLRSCHNLKEVPENERPIVIEFNPWWFSGQEHLARAFLGQLQAVLPKRNEAFKELGEMLGNFSEGIGGLLDLAGITGGMGEKAGALIKTFTERPPKDVPALKEEICAILQQSGKRIIIMIDDIDRLEAEEMRQLFTVIKALADFPNVIYLLAFDQAVVVQAIEKYSGMPGQAYLEKIIQVPFVVPQVDRTVLLNGLANRLEEILEGTPEYLCDQTHWNSFFYNGFDKLFTVPRDIVRFCNTVSVTYPAVRGEVNAVDFTVIEAIRVFLLYLYMYIRKNQHEFVYTPFGKPLSDSQLESILINFVEVESMRQYVKNILKLLFPYIEKNYFGYQPVGRRMLSIGNREIFPCYFLFTPPSESISNIEMRQWLEKAGDANAFGSVLLQAKEQGLSRVRVYLDRLRDHISEDILIKDIPVIIDVLLDIGDELIQTSEDKSKSSVLDNCSLIISNIESLGRRSPLEERLLMLEHAIQAGGALAVQSRLLKASDTASERGGEPLIPQEVFPRFITLLLTKLGKRISDNTWLELANLDDILNVCWQFDSEKLKNLCIEATKKDENMLLFTKKIFMRKFNSLNYKAEKLSHFRQSNIVNYIDVTDFESRIRTLQDEGKIPQEYAETAKLFLQGVALWREEAPEDA